MRLYQDYKKQFKAASLLIIVIIFAAALPWAFARAQTLQNLNDQISQRNAEIAALEAQIAAFQSELDNLGKQKKSLGGSISELDINRKKLVANISVTQKKINNVTVEIEKLSSQIVDKQDSITNATEAIASGLKATNEFDQENIVSRMLSEDDFTLVWNDVDNIVTIREKLREEINHLRQTKISLEDTREESVNAKRELSSLKSNLSDQKKIVEQNTADKKKLLTQTKNNESNYQKLLAESLAKKLAVEKELRAYESELQYILDPSKLPSAGVLSWPLEKIFITQLFGKTEDGKRLYASGSHSGADFRASVGTPVMAMADGVVSGTGDTDKQCKGVSFGKFVFIKYNNGLASAYGHLSLVKATAGQTVKRGQVVAYSGNTGYSTGPHLHVTVYAPDAASMKTIPSKACSGKVLTQPIAAINAYLDPIYYLPPYK
ncbi:MAG TPA: peptidoglycan DD-metalloendopeptidase family protein [Candidatus Paceibacterota bacterium]